MMSKTKRTVALILAAIMVFALFACGEKKAEEKKTDTTENKGELMGYTVTNRVKITMEDGGEIVLALFGEEAPISVENFVSLVESGFYDGLIFHRVVPGFVIQTGDPDGTGFGGSEKTIKGEFAANGVENKISHKHGVLSMARSKNMNSASSQFFICLADVDFLDGNYAAFGAVESGLDVVDAIGAVKTDANDKPVTDVVMKKVEVIG